MTAVFLAHDLKELFLVLIRDVRTHSGKSSGLKKRLPFSSLRPLVDKRYFVNDPHLHFNKAQMQKNVAAGTSLETATVEETEPGCWWKLEGGYNGHLLAEIK